MKSRLITSLAGVMLFCQAATGWAAQTIYDISATVPSATGVSMTVSSVDSTTNKFTTEPSGFTALTFDPLTLSTSGPTSGIFLPDHYWAIDVAVTGGAGTPQLQVQYTEGANPNGGTVNGLGTKSTATFAKEVYTSATTPPTETIVAPSKVRLIDLTSNTTIPSTEFSGGWARVYLGVWTGSTTAPADPSNGKPFTTTDASGPYAGQFTLTATPM